MAALFKCKMQSAKCKIVVAGLFSGNLIAPVRRANAHKRQDFPIIKHFSHPSVLAEYHSKFV